MGEPRSQRGFHFAGLTKVYFNTDGSNTGYYHNAIEDPVATGCRTSGNSVRAYLGPDVLHEYSAYCDLS